MKAGTMKAGDKVNWIWNPRGGYGYRIPVAAVIESITSDHATIRLADKIRGQWVPIRKFVSLANLTVRSSVVPEVDYL